MARPNPKYFTIKVDEIDNGFIVVLENRNDVPQEKRFCEDSEAIIGQIRTWIDLIFKEND